MKCNYYLLKIMIIFRICRKLSYKMFLDFELYIMKNFIFMEIVSFVCIVYGYVM